MERDNETLEEIAKVLIEVNKNRISYKYALEEIYKLVLDNSTEKLKKLLEAEVE